MRMVYSISNFKGGVGKTTTTASVGAALARTGLKVLLVDFDPQGSLSECFAYAHSAGERTIYDAIMECHGLPYFWDSENLAITPADVRLSTVELKLQGDPDRSLRLKALLEPVKSQFDAVIIDCPPAFGVGSTSALVAADHVIIPMEATSLALSGMEKMKVFAERAKTKNPELDILGVVFTRVRGTSANRSIIAAVHKAYPGLAFETAIRENTTLAEASSAHWDIFTYAPRSHGAEDYEALAHEIIERIKRRKDNEK